MKKQLPLSFAHSSSFELFSSLLRKMLNFKMSSKVKSWLPHRWSWWRREFGKNKFESTSNRKWSVGWGEIANFHDTKEEVDETYETLNIDSLYTKRSEWHLNPIFIIVGWNNINNRYNIALYAVVGEKRTRSEEKNKIRSLQICYFQHSSLEQWREERKAFDKVWLTWFLNRQTRARRI